MPTRFARFSAGVKQARARDLLVISGLFIGLTLLVGTGLVILDLRRLAIADAERELKNVSLILADDIDRGFQAAELVQIGVIEHARDLGIDSPEEFESMMTSREVNQELKERIGGLPNVEALGLIATDGQLLNISRHWPVPVINIADRNFFKSLRGDESLNSFIGEPVLNRTNSTWTVVFIRKVTTSDGRLIGFVNAGIQLAYFEKAFSNISLNAGASFSLFRRDGVLLARYPHADPKIGIGLGGTANFALIVASQNHDAIRLNSTLDGNDRIIAPHTLAHFPLLVSVSDTMSAVLTDWWQQVRLLGGGATLLELVLASIVLLGVRHLRSRETLEATQVALVLSEERERSAHAAEIHGLRFNTALNNMLQGLLMFDHAGNLLVINHCFQQLFQLPEEAITPGMTYHELTENIVACGHISTGEMHSIRERHTELMSGGKPATITWDLLDGRTLIVTHQPMEEGWLATYEDITERRRAEAKIAHLAHHDALTDLPNRVLFHETLENALVLAGRGDSLALHYLDLDQFKPVNDTLGHPIGDRLLQAVAQRLREALRASDTAARLGGDEFAIIQTNLKSETEATALASRLIKLIEAPFAIDEHQIIVGVSIGIALSPQDGLDCDNIMQSADLALYRAKLDGRGVYRLFQVDMDTAMQTRRILEHDLRQAQQSGQLELFYQPLIDLRTQIVTGCEALLRWRHPTMGLIPPDRFIPLAEETGLIVPIGEWALRQACAEAARWPVELKVAVNLSAVQFKSRNLIPAVVAALRESGLQPGRLGLEITETAMLQDTDATLATLHALRGLGIHIVMDDFGTGYSSLSYLRLFPFDRIKIDKSFVGEMGDRPDCMAIVRAVTALGINLGMAVTAEGVETRQQLEALSQAGCTEVQGYLFSPAVPVGQVNNMLAKMSDIEDLFFPAGDSVERHVIKTTELLPAL